MKLKFILPIIALGLFAAPGLGASTVSAGTLSSPAAALATQNAAKENATQPSEVRHRRWHRRHWRGHRYYHGLRVRCYRVWRYGHWVRRCHPVRRHYYY